METNRLTRAISLPTSTIHNNDELVDRAGNLICIRSDKGVDLPAIRDVLNAYPEMIEILRDISDPDIFNKNIIKRSREMLSKLGEQ